MGRSDAADQDEPTPAPQQPTEQPSAPKPASRPKKKDWLRDMPLDLVGLGVTAVAPQPESRPVLWGQNKNAKSAAELNLEFKSTEREVIEGLEEIPLITLDLATDEPAADEPDPKKKKPAPK